MNESLSHEDAFSATETKPDYARCSLWHDNSVLPTGRLASLNLKLPRLDTLFCEERLGVAKRLCRAPAAQHFRFIRVGACQSPVADAQRGGTPGRHSRSSAIRFLQDRPPTQSVRRSEYPKICCGDRISRLAAYGRSVRMHVSHGSRVAFIAPRNDPTSNGRVNSAHAAVSQ